MIHLISPAKTLDFESKIDNQLATQPQFVEYATPLIRKLSKTSLKGLKDLMGLSDNLAKLNQQRYQEWSAKTTLDDQSRQAIYAFKGDVYLGLDPQSLSEVQMTYAQENLRILSGLYGYLRPLDIIEPHRLEMGTALKVGRKNNLYQYWSDKIGDKIASDLKDQGHKYLLNLASNEYFKAVNLKSIDVPIIHPEFKDEKNGTYKVISFFAKKARGLMSRFIIMNEIENPNDLKAFNLEGYVYNHEMSSEYKPVFTRDENRRG